MSDNDTSGVEPPENDEMFGTESDERDQMVEQAVQQANKFHQMMDGAKEWSREKATEVRVEAALVDDEETATELEQVAGLIQSVTARIERGDNNRARQP